MGISHFNETSCSNENCSLVIHVAPEKKLIILKLFTWNMSLDLKIQLGQKKNKEYGIGDEEN